MAHPYLRCSLGIELVSQPPKALEAVRKTYGNATAFMQYQLD